MGILNRLFNRTPAATAVETAVRAEPRLATRSGAAQRLKFAQSFRGNRLSGNGEVELSLDMTRARSRELELDTEYVKRWLDLLVQNAVGPSGFTVMPRPLLRDDRVDKTTAARLDEDWLTFTARGRLTICKKYSLKDICELAARAVPRDGEFFVIRERRSDGSFVVRVRESEYLDEAYNGIEKRTGNPVRMSIETDVETEEIVAYHFLRTHPNDELRARARKGQAKRERIPADDVLHIYDRSKRASADRGLPWLHASIVDIRYLTSYEEAELTNVRTSASMPTFVIGGEDGAKMLATDVNPDGSLSMTVEPAALMAMPDDVQQIVSLNRKHPGTDYDKMVASISRKIAAGVNISSHALTSDHSKASFSSLKKAAADDAETYRHLQSLLIDQLLAPLYRWFVRGWLMQADNRFTLLDYSRVGQVLLRGRGWASVDPIKDASADMMSLAMGIKSLQDIHAERGTDFYETIEEIAHERAEMAALGLPMPASPKGVVQVVVNESTDEPDPTGDEDDDANTRPPADDSDDDA